ncbi:MAG: hypothetical protein HY901_06230 [Deltaproteobacteria bacterium]|nr:hypothetical protein [Deltaproteobacteria bacterium]
MRILLAPLAILGGYALGPRAAPLVHLSPQYASHLAAGVAGTCALIWPPCVLFLAFGALGGLAGGELSGQQEYWIGFIPGFLLAGVLALVIARIVAVAVSSVLGALMLVGGLLRVVSITRLAPLVDGALALWVGLAGCMAIVAMAFQFRFNPSEDESGRAQRKADKLKQKELKVEDKAREKRFKQYGAKGS